MKKSKMNPINPHFIDTVVDEVLGDYSTFVKTDSYWTSYLTRFRLAVASMYNHVRSGRGVFHNQTWSEGEKPSEDVATQFIIHAEKQRVEDLRLEFERYRMDWNWYPMRIFEMDAGMHGVDHSTS